MTDEEFIAEAKGAYSDMDISTVLQACEAHYLNGFADDITGDTDWIGHYYRVDRWIVETTPTGVNILHTFATVEDAISTIQEIENDYAEIVE